MTRDEFEALGNKMKYFEGRQNDTVIPMLPMVVRLDGRAFHTFTRGLERPFDRNFSDCMIETTKKLIQETHAKIGYTQSDEITLIFIPEEQQELPFAGKIQKICSIFASIASVEFNKQVAQRLPSKADKVAVFDCRAFTLPTKQSVYECLLWRETDATRNSLSMAVSAYYSEKECFKKGFKEKHDMLHAIGINWDSYPTHFKRGTYLAKTLVKKELDAETLAKIPEKHRPTEPVYRSEVQEALKGFHSISQIGPDILL